MSRYLACRRSRFKPQHCMVTWAMPWMNLKIKVRKVALGNWQVVPKFFYQETRTRKEKENWYCQDSWSSGEIGIKPGQMEHVVTGNLWFQHLLIVPSFPDLLWVVRIWLLPSTSFKFPLLGTKMSKIYSRNFETSSTKQPGYWIYVYVYI